MQQRQGFAANAFLLAPFPAPYSKNLLFFNASVLSSRITDNEPGMGPGPLLLCRTATLSRSHSLWHICAAQPMSQRLPLPVHQLPLPPPLLPHPLHLLLIHMLELLLLLLPWLISRLELQPLPWKLLPLHQQLLLAPPLLLHLGWLPTLPERLRMLNLGLLLGQGW